MIFRLSRRCGAFGLSLAVILVLAAGCTSTARNNSGSGQPSAPAASHAVSPGARAELSKMLDEWQNGTSSVEYEVKTSSTDGSVPPFTGTLLWARAGADRARFDINGRLGDRETQATMIATTEDWITICTPHPADDFPSITPVASSRGLCVHGTEADDAADVLTLILDLPLPSSTGDSTETADPLSGVKITSESASTIAGQAASCFHLVSTDDSPARLEELCFSAGEAATLLQRTETTGPGNSITFTATRVLPPPGANGFNATYPVVETQ